MHRSRLFYQLVFRLFVFAGLTHAVTAESVSFPEFNTGVITGGGAVVSKTIDVSGVPELDYNIVSVIADFVPGASPQDAYSSTIRMALTNADGSVSYWPLSAATTGVIPGAGTSASGPTVLRWTGILPTGYAGGAPLRVRFSDVFTDASGPYTSELRNVSVTLHAAPQPAHTFTGFDTGTLTGAGAAFNRTLSTAGLPDLEHFLVNVTADFVPGPSPNDAYSSTIRMEMNNGGATVFFPSSNANHGVLSAGGATRLQWSGLLRPGYVGGSPLGIRFLDTFTDASGPYTSELRNVVVTVYPLPSPKQVFGPLSSGTITGGGAAVSVPVNTSSLPATEYVHYEVTGTFNATNGSEPWSETMRLSLGGGMEYLPFLKANSGFLGNASSTTLRWSGVLPKAYLGGASLNLLFKDTFTDASGPYTSTMSNVSVTLYPAYVPSASIVSLDRADATPSKAATVNWSLVLDTEVTGITASNFSLSPTVTGASVGTPTTGDSGLTWNIPVATGSGDGTLTLNVANTAGWSIAPSSGVPFAGQAYLIDKTPPAVTSATTAGGTFGASFEYTITASGGAVGFGATGLPAGLSLSGNIISGTPAETGSFPVSLTATDAAGNTGGETLSLAIAKAAATVSLGDLEQTYDGGAHPVTAVTTPGGLAVNIVYGGLPTAPTDAGNHEVVATIADDNYEGSETGTLVVGKVQLLVTADHLTRAYQFANPELTATITGFVNDEDLSVLTGVPELSTVATPSSLPADYPITTAIGTLSATNYDFSTADGILTVRKRNRGDWDQEHFSPVELEDDAISGTLADADSDGVVNLIEFAFGTDPRDPASGPAPLEYSGDFAGGGALTANGQTLLRFEPSGPGVDFRVLFIRLNPAFTAAPSYVPEFSVDLLAWQASTATPAVLAEDGLYQLVSVPYPFFVDGKKARFHRIRVLPLD